MTSNPDQTPDAESASEAAEQKRIADEQRSVITNIPIDDREALAVVDGDPAGAGSDG